MLVNSLKAFLVGAALLGGSMATAGNTTMFLKAERAGGALVEGESADANHPKQIEIDSFAWSSSNPAVVQRAGAGISAGKVVFSDLSFTKRLDKSSSALMQAGATGTIFPKMTIDVVKQRVPGESKPTAYLVIELKDVVVTSYSLSNSDGSDAPSEEITLAFGAYRQTYTPLKADGKPDTPQVGQWNIVTNTPVFGANKDGVPESSDPPVASGTKVSVEQQ